MGEEINEYTSSVREWEVDWVLIWSKRCASMDVRWGGAFYSVVYSFFSSLNFRDLHMLIGTANKSHIRETDNGYLRNLWTRVGGG